MLHRRTTVALDLPKHTQHVDWRALARRFLCDSDGKAYVLVPHLDSALPVTAWGMMSIAR